ncbi:hypothetical protein BXZ70DRAFT_601721 [Cristinia sonorae]|uniref:T6SS Phospholipase effector Tle1-like catalytic domain-containing protein n=1 Tax=Cristinia sonorae TaxID=1940300 RepID=A0A8K0UVS9_9AGAR|nr:hypothetical protein BXZ70DRAFT_601721 [Cristinia sonorae]
MDAQPASSTSTSPVLPQATNPIAPPPVDRMKRRNLILCFDGTSNQFDGDNTNVVKFYSLLKKDDGEQQICYYQPGIGTYFQPGVVSPFFQWAAKIMDQAVAWYLDEHVRGGYIFLMQNYRAGDKICIFGFSRGAYTARALAGMLHKIGLLPKDNPEQVPFAYKLYKQTGKQSLEIAAGFKQTFCRTVNIEFVGVWDTVASVGVVMARNLPFTTSNTTIKTFRHAVSLDERRVKFRPNLYHRPAPDAESARKDPNQASPVIAKTAKDNVFEKVGHAIEDGVENLIRRVSSQKGKERKGKGETPMIVQTVGTGLSSIVVAEAGAIPPEDVSILDSAVDVGSGSGPLEPVKSTDVLEVWFAGCHSDVGGGAVKDDVEHSLSEITLRWMVRQVVLSQVGITFEKDALMRARIPNSVFTGVGFPVTPPAGSRFGLQTTLKLKPTDDNNNSPFSSPKTGKLSLEIPGKGDRGDGASQTSAALTEIDAVQPIHDALKTTWAWWILEILPLSYAYQDGKGKWHRRIGIHLGKGRRIPDIDPKFHRSVQERMADDNLKYTPKAVWKKGTEQYVD